MRPLMTVLLVLNFACTRSPHPSTRPVVQYPSSSVGFALGPSDAEVILLEFGSFACRYCEEFHDSVLPKLGVEGRGSVRFKFVVIDTLEPFMRLALWARCITPAMGAQAALDSAFGIVIRTFGKGDHSGNANAVLADRLDCQPRDSIGLLEEARRASAFGVRAIPTFLVGVEEDGYVRGWFVEGIRTDLLMQTLDSVRLRLARKPLK